MRRKSEPAPSPAAAASSESSTGDSAAYYAYIWIEIYQVYIRSVPYKTIMLYYDYYKPNKTPSKARREDRSYWKDLKGIRKVWDSDKRH